MYEKERLRNAAVKMLAYFERSKGSSEYFDVTAFGISVDSLYYVYFDKPFPRVKKFPRGSDAVFRIPLQCIIDGKPYKV